MTFSDWVLTKWKKWREKRQEVATLKAQIVYYEARAASLNAFIDSQAAVAELQQKMLGDKFREYDELIRHTAVLALYANKTVEQSSNPALTRLYREAVAEVARTPTEELPTYLQKTIGRLSGVTLH